MRRALIGLVAAVALVLGGLIVSRLLDPAVRIPGVAGPSAITPLPAAPAAALPDAFPASGGTSALALWVTDSDSDWLSLAFGLRSIGVPLVVTTEAARATQHTVVLAYPRVSGRTVSAAASMALRQHVQAGGTVVGFEVLGAGLADVFGLTSVQEGAERRQLRFESPGAQRWGFDAPQEREIRLGTAQAPLRGVGLQAAPAARVLATFEDASPALLEHRHGKGRAYTLAFDAGAFIAGAQQGRRALWQEYINSYEPAVDVLLRWLKAVYREGQPSAVTLATAPEGRALSVVLSHDVDFSGSMRNALDYARSEARQKVRSTFFVQTKYVKDWSDERFFDANGLALARELQALGGELASHSVAHTPVFATVPVGTGEEIYSDYTPYVQSKEKTRGATVLGELRISQMLLEQASGGRKVDSFRPGHLAYPKSLPEALQATGYRFSSSVSSGMALSHLPFQLSHQREGRAPVSVFEFPITLEDERVRPMDTVLLPQAIKVADRLARYGGLCLVLIHPNVLDDKLRFQEAFVTAMRERGAWFGTVGEFGAWWRARDAVQIDVTPGDSTSAPHLRIHAPEAIRGLALQLPEGWRAPLASGRNAAHGWVMDLPAGPTQIVLERAH